MILATVDNFAVFQSFFDEIINYIDINKPPKKEVLYFLGTLWVGVLESLEVEESERIFLTTMFSEIIKKRFPK